MVKIKNFLQRNFFCKHYNTYLIRWRWTHGPYGNDPAFITAEYCCEECGKVIRKNVYRRDAIKFAREMAMYKEKLPDKEGIYAK